MMAAPHLSRLLRLPRAEAREQDNEHAEEEQDHGGENGPHAGRVVGVGAGGMGVGVDVVFDDLFVGKNGCG